MKSRGWGSVSRVPAFLLFFLINADLMMTFIFVLSKTPQHLWESRIHKQTPNFLFLNVFIIKKKKKKKESKSDFYVGFGKS